MTKKDYVALAAILASKRDEATVEENVLLDRVASHIAVYCKSQNERFDKTKFLEACNSE